MKTFARSLTKADFEQLSEFRYQMRRFERFSEQATQNENITPLQYLLLLHIKGYPERGCPGCSFVADQVAHLAHLNARDTTLVFASRAPQAEIARLKEQMGWEVPWYTITDEFDADFDVREWHGTNAFLRDGGEIFRTYFVDARGDEAMGSTWSYLDITALGRQEEWEDSPEGYPQTPPYSWWNYHDNYDAVSAK